MYYYYYSIPQTDNTFTEKVALTRDASRFYREYSLYKTVYNINEPAQQRVCHAVRACLCCASRDVRGCRGPASDWSTLTALRPMALRAAGNINKTVSIT